MAFALLDTAVLVHAAYRGAASHAQAAALVQLGLKEAGRYCVAPQNLVEFAAIVTRARFVHPPLAAEEAARMAALLYRSRKLKKLYPMRGTVARALREGRALGIAGPGWFDLLLACTMRDHGVEVIVTEDLQSFRRIPFVHPRSVSQAAASL